MPLNLGPGRPALWAMTALGLGSAFGLASPPSERTGPRAGPESVRLYVPNQMGASVSVVDGSGRLVETVDLRRFGFSEQAMPHQVAAASDGSAWYVTLVGDGLVARFSRENELVARAEIELPGMIVMDAGRDRLYVSRALRAVDPPRSLAVLRASDLTVVEEPDIFVSRPHALAVDTVSGRVYSGSLGNDQIASFDPQTGRVEVTNADGAGNGIIGLAVSPDGRRVVATTQLTNRLLAFDATGPGPLVPIASIPVEAGPYDVAYSPDGASVWFPNQQANAVTRVDATSWTVGAVIRSDLFAEPHGVAITPDSRTVYITSHGKDSGAPDPTEISGRGPRSAPANGNVVIVDAAADSIRSVTEVGPFAAAPGLAHAVPSPSRQR